MLVAGLLACLAEVGPLDRLLQGADRIAVARVEAVRPLKNSAQQVAELSVSKVLYGPENEALILFPATVSSALLEPGRSYVLFLQRSTGSPLTTAQERSLAPLLKGAPVYVGVASWRVDGESVIVPPGNLPKTGGPAEATAGPGGDHVALGELVAWLAARIGSSLPSIRAQNVTTGPKTWEFSILPDGTILGRGASKERLESAELKELWEAFEKERFGELPESVGASQGPDEPGGSIEIRTREGRHVVLIQGDFLDQLTPDEREPAERALRLWHVLPIAEPALRRTKK